MRKPWWRSSWAEWLLLLAVLVGLWFFSLRYIHD